MKKCRGICGENKPLVDFYENIGYRDGHDNTCKECKKKYQRETRNDIEYAKTEKGVIRIIYKTQRANSKRRKLEMPTYSKYELRDWLYENGFKELYDNWVLSGYQKSYKPSIDRKNDYEGYSFMNIRLGTWKENKDKQTQDILLGRSTSGERCKKVLQYSLDGKFINEYVSASAAGRSTGLDFRGISKVCLGKQKTCGGFKFKYSCDIQGN